MKKCLVFDCSASVMSDDLSEHMHYNARGHGSENVDIILDIIQQIINNNGCVHLWSNQ